MNIQNAQFTKIYAVIKALRFSLIPVDNTERNIHERLLDEEEQFAKDFKFAKKIIDQYYKNFINENLAKLEFTKKELEEFEQKYKNHTEFKDKNKNKDDDKSREALRDIKTELRKKTVTIFNTSELFKSNFITEVLPKWLEENDVKIEGKDNPNEKVEKIIPNKNKKQEEKTETIKWTTSIIKKFECWTTYFDGFNNNRKNMYTAEEHSTGIAYRIIHDNLPKFIRNIDRYIKAKDLGVDFDSEENTVHMNTIYDKLEIKHITLDEIFSLNFFNRCLTQSGIDQYNIILGGIGVEGGEKKTQGVNEIINLFAHKNPEKAKLIRSCKLNELFKQILGDSNSGSFRLEDVKTDSELIQCINDAFIITNEHLIGKKEITNDFTQKVETIEIDISTKITECFDDFNPAIDQQQVYINRDALSGISKNLFGDWSIISDVLRYYAETQLYPEKNKSKEVNAKRETWTDKNPYYSFYEIHTALYKYFDQYKDQENKNNNKEEDKKQDAIWENRKQIAQSNPLFAYFKKLSIQKTEDNVPVNLLTKISQKYISFLEIYEKYKNGTIGKEKELQNNKDDVRILKEYLDSIMDLQHFIKPLIIKLNNKDSKQYVYKKNEDFYDSLNDIFRSISNIVNIHSITRNYVTQKPYNIEKLRLNFKHQTLLGGFMDSHTDKSDNGTQYGAYLFRKKSGQDYDYFLGISKNAKLFRKNSKNKKNGDKKSIYERLNYRQAKSTTFFYPAYGTDKRIFLNMVKSKIVPKLSSLNKVQEDVVKKKVDESFLEKVKLFKDNATPTSIIGSFIKADLLDLLNKEKAITNIINTIIKELLNHIKQYSNNNSQLKIIVNNSANYKGKGAKKLKELIESLQEIGKNYKVFKYFHINQRELEEALSSEKTPFYLFKIVNKDLEFNEKKAQNLRRGKLKLKEKTMNLHTLYFKMLMSGTQNVIDIGTGKIFYRKATKMKTVVHEANKPILCKTYIDNKDKRQTIPLEIYQELSAFYSGKCQKHDLSIEARELWESNQIKTKTFGYNIQKDKRYGQNTFLLHLSIKMNYTKPDKVSINDKINKFLHQNKDISIIGIDRGERHLAYYTVINQQGVILDQGSLNNPNNGNTDYQEKLHQREKERGEARKSWGTIEKIKDLKEGYLSIVVHKLAQLIIKHNAIIVFEDLNFGFKRGRFKIEKQVYQKLEKALITKLNYLVFKDKDSDDPGGLGNALQLTEPFTSFEEIGKQTGIIFYVPAYHTSKICPTTGFVNLLYPKYEKVEQAQEFWGKFDKINYNQEKGYFEFHIDYKKFGGKIDGCKTKWTVCSMGKRLENSKNKDKNNNWDTREIDVSEKLTALFIKHKINFDSQLNIKDVIIKNTEADFFRELTWILKLVLQMRNSKIGTDEDWLISPVADANGNFFDSQNDYNGKLPQDADANGAYHIALKGLWNKKQIDEKFIPNKKLDLSITNAAWYTFVQEKKYKKK